MSKKKKNVRNRNHAETMRKLAAARDAGLMLTAADVRAGELERLECAGALTVNRGGTISVNEKWWEDHSDAFPEEEFVTDIKAFIDDELQHNYYVEFSSALLNKRLHPRAIGYALYLRHFFLPNLTNDTYPSKEQMGYVCDLSEEEIRACEEELIKSGFLIKREDGTFELEIAQV